MGKNSRKGSAKLTDASIKKAYDLSIAMAKLGQMLTFTRIEFGDRLLGFVADLRGDSPFYYIFDTDAADTPEKNHEPAHACLMAVMRVTNRKINETNVQYGWFPMQRHTPNASFELTFWMMERMVARINAEPTRFIADVLEDCFKDWCILTLDSEDLQKQFVRLQSARMSAFTEASRAAGRDRPH